MLLRIWWQIGRGKLLLALFIGVVLFVQIWVMSSIVGGVRTYMPVISLVFSVIPIFLLIDVFAVARDFLEYILVYVKVSMLEVVLSTAMFLMVVPLPLIFVNIVWYMCMFSLMIVFSTILWRVSYVVFRYLTMILVALLYVVAVLYIADTMPIVSLLVMVLFLMYARNIKVEQALLTY